MEPTMLRLLAGAVLAHLDAVDRLAAAQRTAVGDELRRLTASWRALLRLHGCRHCPGVRAGPLCAVWRVAAAYFVRRD